MYVFNLVVFPTPPKLTNGWCVLAVRNYRIRTYIMPKTGADCMSQRKQGPDKVSGMQEHFSKGLPCCYKEIIWSHSL